MPPKHRERLTGAEADFAIAIHELRQVTSALRGWQMDAADGSQGKLDALQDCLDQILKVDGRIVEARQQRDNRETDWKAIDDDYAAGLRDAIETVQALASMLDAERGLLAPRLDSGVKQREVRSAYARALSQH